MLASCCTLLILGFGAANAQTIQGTSGPEINVTPDSLKYGNVHVDSSLVDSVLVENFGDQNIVVNVTGTPIIGTDPSQFSIVSGGAPFVVPPENDHKIYVRFKPTSLGAKSAFLRIINNDANESIVDVSLTGTGVSPDITISPASFNYGNVQQFYSANKNFVVGNTGTGILHVDSARVVGPDSVHFGIITDTPFTVAPSDTHGVIVQFTPATLGAKSATLRLFTDDPDENPLNVALSGNGVFPDISVDPTTFDFGDVAVNSAATKAFVVSNTGTGNLDVGFTIVQGDDSIVLGKNRSVASGEVTGPYTIISGGAPFTVPPSGSHNIVVQFAPDFDGQQNAHLIIQSNDPDEGENPFSVPLTANGILVSDISVAPPTKDYGNILLGSNASQIFVISNEGSADLVVNINGTTLTGANANQFSITGGGAPFTLAPAATRDLTVSFHPTVAGADTAILRIESNDPDESLFDVQLAGKGVVPDIAISPISKDYGNVQVNSNSSQIFAVTNEGTTDLVVASGGTALTGTNADQFTIISGGAPFTVAPAGTRNIVVRFNPTTEGTKNASLEITSNDPDEGTVTAPLTGKGVNPDIAVDPTTKDFGNIAVNATASQTFAISNTGTGDLVIAQGGTSFTGTNANQFSILSGGAPFTLAPSQSNNLVVQFQPTSGGTKTATLQITSNDPDESPFNVSLTGNGSTNAEISVSPPSNDYGSVLLGSSESQTFVVSNLGTADLVINVNGTTLLGTNANQFAVIGGGAPFTLAPAATRDVIVEFTPTIAGVKSATLRIESNDSDENLTDVPLSGTGVGIPDIASNPASKDYGDVEVGSTASQTFVISNTGTDSLVVSDEGTNLTGTDAEEFSIISGGAPFKVGPAGSHNLVVEFAPANLGEKGATLQISSNDPDENPLDIALSGNGIVIPDISIDPTSKDYGSVGVGSTASQTFVITNNGTGDLVVGDGGTTLTGTNADQFEIVSESGAPFTVVPAGTHDIVVEFSPTTQGAKSASLQIASNDPDENPLSVELTGNGINNQGGAPAAPVNLAAAPTGWTSTGSFTLTWTNPAHDTKITGAFYKIGSTPSGPTDGTLVSGNNLTTIIKNTDASLLGSKTWYVWLVDSLGNASELNSSTVTTQFDDVPPVTTSNAKFTYYNSNAVIQLSPADSHSGLDSTSYRINDGAVQSGTIATITTEGDANSLEFWSVDIAGNEEEHHVLDNIKIDKTKPTATASAPSSSGGNSFNIPVVADDNLSGVSFVELWYRFNGSSWLKYPGKYSSSPIAFDSPFGAGTYDFEAVATDVAGNIETLHLITESSTLVTDVNAREPLPTEFALQQNYPNPFNPTTTIEFALPQPEKVRILVYDVSGNLVRALVDGQQLPQGTHRQSWNGRNDRGEQVSSGMYFYRLQAGKFSQTRKMLLVK